MKIRVPLLFLPSMLDIEDKVVCAAFKLKEGYQYS